MVCLPEVERELIGVTSGEADTFDVEKAIANLLADPSCASVELPCKLSAQQRKHAKKIIEQHPDLKCESFGLGDDRQMHVFKRTADCSPHPVSVKNTFIDDWIQPDGMPADRRIVQSMPHNMFAERLSAEIAGYALPNMEDKTIPKDGMVSAVCPMDVDNQIALGTEVVIEGLVKAPHFNGACGVVQSWDADTQRYNIRLAFTTPNGQCWAKVKGENLKLAPPAAVSFGCFDA